jgi:hypothetical protein
VWALADEPAAAVTVLRANVPPAKPVLSEQVAQLVGRLDAPRFSDREAATKALTELGRLAGPALKAALGKGLSPEAKERGERLLAAQTGDPAGEDLRRSRAVQAMELAGTAKARALLREWAAGAPGARLTEDAAAALARLGRE